MVEDSYRKQALVDEENCLIEVVDSASGEEHGMMRRQSIRDAEGFVFVYSITSRVSFDQITQLRDEVLQIKDADTVSMVLVGNKCDLDVQRQVSVADGEELARLLDVPFKETSAKTRLNVEEAFFALVRRTRRCGRAGNPFAQRPKPGCVAM